MLDATVVNVALPAIGQDFGVSLTSLQWIVNAYTLTLAGLLLLGGALGDRYGRRRLFVVGILWFAGASLICGIGPQRPGADRGQGAPGDRRRPAHAGEPCDHRDHVPPGGPLGRDRRLVGPRGRDDREVCTNRRWSLPMSAPAPITPTGSLTNSLTSLLTPTAIDSVRRANRFLTMARSPCTGVSPDTASTGVWAGSAGRGTLSGRSGSRPGGIFTTPLCTR